MTTSVVLLMLASSVVVLTLLAASTIVSSRRATVARRDAVIELQQWSSGRGWTVPGRPPAELVDRWADQVYPGERLLMAAHGFERGHHCAALLYDGPDSEGAHAPRQRVIRRRSSREDRRERSGRTRTGAAHRRRCGS